MTAKQVANALEESGGNVHYHIQRLLQGGLITLTNTREVGGITEKYYQAPSTRFSTKQRPDPTHLTMVTWLTLNDEEVEELLRQIEVVLQAWEKCVPGQGETGSDYEVKLEIKRLEGSHQP